MVRRLMRLCEFQEDYIRTRINQRDARKFHSATPLGPLARPKALGLQFIFDNLFNNLLTKIGNGDVDEVIVAFRMILSYKS